MKKLHITLTCIAGFSGMVFAQMEKKDVAMAESIFGKAKPSSWKISKSMTSGRSGLAPV
jgi:hypothetical protein